MTQVENAIDVDTEDCYSCGEDIESLESWRCPKSRRLCGHHCNHSWTDDECHWCGHEFGPVDKTTRDVSRYGEPPVEIGEWSGESFRELMHWLYLPVHLSHTLGYHTPMTLRSQGITEVLDAAVDDYSMFFGNYLDKYVYVTARRGFATPDNPLNRTGWHTDGFGTDDVNYIWSDVYPTRWIDGPDGMGDVPDDHVESQEYFDFIAAYARTGRNGLDVREVEPQVIYRLSPYVVHSTPLVPKPGGMRSWVKVSISDHKYNLIGNSHNWELDYDWEMVSRDVLRNDPAHALNDFVEQ